MKLFEKTSIILLLLLAPVVSTSCVSDDADFFTTIDENENASVQTEIQNDILLPLTSVENDSNYAEVFVRTDIPRANIYLNGNYHGRSPLRLTNIVPGYYLLRVEFAEDPEVRVVKNYMINLESGRLNEYYIEK